MFKEITRGNCILSVLWTVLSLKTQVFKMYFFVSVRPTKVLFVILCEMEKQMGKTNFSL